MRRTALVTVAALLVSFVVLAGRLPAHSAVLPAQQFEQIELAQAPEEAQFAPGEILVKFVEDYSERNIADIAAEYDTEVLEIGARSGIVRMGIPEGADIEEMSAVYSRDPRVDFAQPNPLAFAHGPLRSMVLDAESVLGDDPFLPDDPFFFFQTELFLTNVPDAWNIQQGQPGVDVAVLDTGAAFEKRNVDPSDPVFAVFGNSRFVRAPDLDDTHFSNNGIDTINGDRHANDDADFGHGTFVSGGIAQTTDNGLGSAGTAFDTGVMPVKVLGNTGSGSLFSLIEGLLNAIDEGVDVINMSLGFPGIFSLPAFDPFFVPLDDVLQQAHDEGIVIVASSGNGGFGIVSRPALDPNVIAVGASNFDGTTRAGYSQFSSLEGIFGIPPTPGLPGSIEIVAPAGDFTDKDFNGIPDGPIHQSCLCLFNPEEFFFFIAIGTSFSAPQVAAAAALLIENGQRWSKDGAGVEEIRRILRDTAQDLGPAGFDLEFGSGQLDVLAALEDKED